MDNIAPIKLQGIWDEGYALDRHSIYSIPLGVDDYGKMRYDTKRTIMGELIYHYKYYGEQECLEKIITLAEPFLKYWLGLKNIATVLPVPPTDKNREFQPVFEIGKRVAKILDAYYYEDVLIKESKIQSKNLGIIDKKKIEDSIAQIKTAKKKQNILLVDDLFQSGATLTECVRELKKDKNINKIYVLTMTKTRSG